MNPFPITKEKIAAFFVGLLSPFTVSLVGEMPVGEVVLLMVFGWMVVYLTIEHRWPGNLLRNRLLRWMLVCQGFALLGYVISDLCWGSSPLDMARGWARMAFLGIDLFTLGYLFLAGRKGTLIALQWGAVIGGMIPPLIARPLFGDYWKFGFGTPVCLAVLLLLPSVGFWLGEAALFGLCALNFLLNFRSLSATFLVVSVLLLVIKQPVVVRLFILPVFVLLTGMALVVFTELSGAANRNHDLRSDVSRTAMLEAAAHGFVEHPLMGNGSWFSRSDVINDFLERRFEKAQEIHLGGIARQAMATDEENPYAIHSQLLVALAEGGILGGAFFLLYGAALFWTTAHVVLFQRWTGFSALYLYVLINAFFNLLMSPFSGVHRVYIAVASGLVLVIWGEEYAGRQPKKHLSGLRPRWRLPRPAPGPVALNS